MSSKRSCPLFRGFDVVVEDFCVRCGHYNKDNTGCDHYHNSQLVKLKVLSKAEFDKKHENMGVS